MTTFVGSQIRFSQKSDTVTALKKRL